MIRQRTIAFPVILLIAGGFGNSALRGAPVDLSAPRNALGAADENGQVRYVHRFGDVFFSDNFSIPLRFDFSSRRVVEGVKSEFGWHGWQCGAVESKATFPEDGRLLRIDLLCAKVLLLEREADDPARYRTVDGSWTGIVEGERVKVEREDGWSLQFVSGRVDRLRTDKGRWILWERDTSGRVIAVREQGDATPALALEWAAGRVSRIVADRADLSFSWNDDTLAGIAWQIEGRDTNTYICVQKPDSLAVVTPAFDTYRFFWNPETGIVRGDGLHTYALVSQSSGGGKAGSRRLVMRSPDGSSESYLLGSLFGESLVTTPAGREIRTIHVSSEGPDNGGVARVEWERAGEQPVVLMANTYDEKGRVVRRLWRGDPRKLDGYRGGKIDPALMPERALGFEGEELDAVDPATPLAMIEFHYHESGEIGSVVVNREPALAFRYDAEGRLAEVKCAGRFRVSSQYPPDGGTIDVTEIERSVDNPFWYLETDDPSVGPDLVVRRKSDPDGRVLEETMADGRRRRIEYDGRMRRVRDAVVARDGTTAVQSITYVHDSGSATVLRIREDLLTGGTDYAEISAYAIGLPVRGRPLAPEVALHRLEPSAPREP